MQTMKTMKTWFQGGLMMLAVGLILASISVATAPRDAIAATQNYSGVPVSMLPVFLSGEHTASASSVASIQVPAKMKLIGVSATARSASGVSDTLTLNVRAGATSVLSAPLAVSSVSVAEGTITTSTIPDETVLHIDTSIGGTSPAWYDISILLTLIPL